MYQDAEHVWQLYRCGADASVHVRNKAQHGGDWAAQAEHTSHVEYRVDRQNSSGDVETLDEDNGDRRRMDGGTHPAST